MKYSDIHCPYGGPYDLTKLYMMAGQSSPIMMMKTVVMAATMVSKFYRGYNMVVPFFCSSTMFRIISPLVSKRHS